MSARQIAGVMPAPVHTIMTVRSRKTGGEGKGVSECHRLLNSARQHQPSFPMDS